ncbi:MAG: T9SS type A sorting domain-containing protein [Taibaiella sp.]|jgi:hypothetical protein
MMKKLLFCLSVLLFLAAATEAKKPNGSPATVSTLKKALPLLFTENKGQVTNIEGKPRPDILFTATGDHTQLFLTATGIQYQFTRIIYPEGYGARGIDAAKQEELAKQVETQTHLFSLTLQGANPEPVIRREKKNPFTENFYTPNVPKEGITQVATYEKIVYENIYPHIDWVLYSQGKKLKYDFVVHPGGDPSLIKLNIQDAESVSITAAGELLMKTSLGEVKEKAPLSFANGKEVPSRFKQNSDGTIGFEITTVPGATLVIDPSVTWGTYYGGTGQENAEGLTLDASGNIYIAGITASTTSIAMTGGYQTTINAVHNNFLVKFNASGTPLWATYYGSACAAQPGTNLGQGGACATDNSGNVYLLATTPVAPLTVDMSTPGAYQTVPGGSSDAYLVKFNASGVRQWATYYGGSGYEYTFGCTSNAAGDVYITGITISSSGIATAGAHQTVYGGGGSDFFLAKFNTSGALQWGTYIGGTGIEGPAGSGVTSVFHNCALDNLGNILVAGNTESTSGIASPGAQQTVLNGPTDAFLAKFSPSGSRLWSTYFGGSDLDAVVGMSVAVDTSNNNIYLTGDTYSTTGIATAGASQTAYSGNGDNFLAKFNTSGTLQWATYQGNIEWEAPACVSVNAAGSVYLAGGTYSYNTLTGGFKSYNSGGAEGFIFKYSNTGSLQWSSYYGGASIDYITACVTSGQDLFILGKTNSAGNIATSGAFDTTLAGSLGGIDDAFLAKISDIPACFPDSVVVTQTICSNQLPYTWQGNTVPAGGINVATDTLTNATGCDSVLHLTLIVKPISTLIVNDTVCRNDLPFVWNSISVPAPATGNTTTATYTTPAANNCDSIVTLNLYIRDTSAVTVTKTYCRNDLPVVWNGFTIPITANSNPAYAIYATTNMGGCDSIVKLNLVVRDTFALTVHDTICRNDFPLVWNGITINSPAGNSATAIYNGSSMYGCDSVVTLQLHVKDTSAFTVLMTKCSNQLPFIWNGINVTAGGPSAATYTTNNAVGCDSVVKLNLTVNNTSAFTQLMTKCSNQLPFVWNGITVTTGGPTAATYTIPNSVGCDSVTTLNLTVNNTSTYTDHDTICASELPYTWNGITVTSGGTSAATFVDTNTAGCDSIVTLNLTVTPAILPTINISVFPATTVSPGTPVTFTATITNGGTAPILQWKKNGINVGINSATYTDFSIDSGDVVICTLLSNAQCAFPDSVSSNEITITVIIPPPPCLVPVTLISTDIQFSSAIFRWANVASASGYEIVLDMQSSDPSSGLFTTDTAYHASTLMPGTHYFHIRTRCANGDYSPWIKITITIQDENGSTGTIDLNGNHNRLTLYPNPNNGMFFVQGTVSENKANIDVVDKAGRIIYRSEANTPGGKLNHRINLSDKLTQGIYLLRVISGTQVYVLRFVHN